MVTTLDSYNFVTRDLTRSLKRVAQQPQVARETENYLDNIASVKSPDDFIKNDRVYRYAMTAFGLEDMLYAKAFIKKVLTEGLSSPNSLANRLIDPRYKELVSVFNFARDGSAATSSPEARQGTVDRYVRLTLENQSGENNEGVKLALYFARKAPSLTSTLGILADKNLLKVAQIALNIPATTGLMDIDKQAKMYAARINVADFKDPVKLKKFIIRFTSQWEMTNGPAASSLSSPAMLFGSASMGVSANVLASLQNLKLGGI